MRTGGTNGYTGGKQAGDKQTDSQMSNGKWKKQTKNQAVTGTVVRMAVFSYSQCQLLLNGAVEAKLHH